MPASRIRNRRPCMERRIENMFYGSPLYSGCKHVTFVAQRFDEPRCARIVAQFLAQAADVQIDGAVQRVGLAALGQVQQLVAVECAVRAFQQHLQQTVFAAREHDHQTGFVLQLPGGLVQCPVGEVPHRWVAGGFVGGRMCCGAIHCGCAPAVRAVRTVCTDNRRPPFPIPGCDPAARCAPSA